MSKVLADYLQKNLVPKYDAEQGTFSPEIQEEFLTEAGWIDRAYICAKLDIHLSMDTFRKTIKQCFGATQFIVIPLESEISKQHFLEHIYNFGQFNNMRSYVGITYATTGELITRQDVYSAIIGA